MVSVTEAKGNEEGRRLIDDLRRGIGRASGDASFQAKQVAGGR
jgi:hypothetical protein